MTIILSFSWMFTREASFLRKNTCCANPSRLKKSQVWSTQTVTKWSVRKPRIPQSTADTKDNMLPQEYMWAPLFPNYLLDIQHAKDQESSTEFNKMHQRTFVRTKKSLLQHFFINSVADTCSGCFYFHKKNCNPVSEKLTTMSFIIALIVVKREAKVFRTI